MSMEDILYIGILYYISSYSEFYTCTYLLYGFLQKTQATNNWPPTKRAFFFGTHQKKTQKNGAFESQILRHDGSIFETTVMGPQKPVGYVDARFLQLYLKYNWGDL